MNAMCLVSTPQSRPACTGYEGARSAHVEAMIAGQLQQGSLCSAGLLPAQSVQAEYASPLWAIHGCQLVPRSFAQHAQHHAAAAVCSILLQSVQQLSCPAIAQACVSTQRQLMLESGVTTQPSVLLPQLPTASCFSLCSSADVLLSPSPASRE